MGQVLHQCVKTTHTIRAEIQNTDAPVAELAKRYNINFKTVLKWKHREGVKDVPMGLRQRTIKEATVKLYH